ncbi:DUF2332 domain-containing protein [Glaciihabitans sp. dw_435]|uniref:DUF2332 domain-containing protein n=1 Tax=Glaciihabitans sp. dw_435 TaxID=2720081 RepID=UPI001BD433B3|nr:DUF2332 domain-containing protein [Glaciihabitans sp. dw_435]
MTPTAEWYLRFADTEAAGQSAIYEGWARGVAADDELLALIDELPRPKRQPNLIFAVSRLLGAPDGLAAPDLDGLATPAPDAVPAPAPDGAAASIPPDTSYSAWRAFALSHWDAIASEAQLRSTQTNEPRRLAAMLPLLAAIPGPLALLEVGSSASLCLYPDRYSYAYNGVRLDPVAGPSTVLLECEVDAPAPPAPQPPLPHALPTVVWRAGIDLNPLDPADPDDMRWLETLVWPEQHARRARIIAAAAIVRADPPLVVRGDAVQDLARVAALAPAGATLVVISAGTLVYLSTEDRARFAATVTAIGARWISLEGAGVIPSVRDELAGREPSASGSFVLGLDGHPVAWCGPHGQSLEWLV